MNFDEETTHCILLTTRFIITICLVDLRQSIIAYITCFLQLILLNECEEYLVLSKFASS